MELEQAQKLAEIIKEAVQKMGIDCSVSIEENIRGHVFNISSPDSNLLIGQRGANLFALQVLMHSVALRKFNIIERFSLDVDDYRKKREWYLRETAKKAIERVKRSGRPVALEPMPAYERRIIHAYLSEDWSVDTESTGVEPNRKIVIKPKDKNSII